MKATGKTAAKGRLEAQRRILKAGHFFKLICGAGNEDPDEVYKLSLVYTLAGALGIDLAARADVVTAAKRGVADAKKLAPEYGIKEFIEPYLTVSVGMAGDPHVRKARILDDNCTECNACIPVCPTEAIPKSLTIIESRCIGCGACGVACQDDAIGYSHKTIAMEKVLKECVAAGAENIELHCAVPDHEQSLKEWKIVSDVLPDGFISVCVDRGYLSNHELKKRLELMLEHARGRMIVQADGIPMSGGKDDFNTTLQAVATADIVAKMKLPVYLLLSGGTNSKTVELSKACGVPYAGASLGTYARHLVYEHLNDPAFPAEKALRPAVEKARRLVETCRPME